MSKFIFSTLLSLFPLSLFAYDELHISRDQFGKPQEFVSRYNDGTLKLMINNTSVKNLGNGMIEGTIEYTVSNQLKGDIDHFELDFELENRDRREIMDIKEHLGRLAEGETKSFTATYSRPEKRMRPSTEVETVKVELDNVYLVHGKKEIKF